MSRETRELAELQVVVVGVLISAHALWYCDWIGAIISVLGACAFISSIAAVVWLASD